MYVPRDTCMRTRTRAYVLMHTCTHTHTHTHTHVCARFYAPHKLPSSAWMCSDMGLQLPAASIAEVSLVIEVNGTISVPQQNLAHFPGPPVQWGPKLRAEKQGRGRSHSVILGISWQSCAVTWSSLCWWKCSIIFIVQHSSHRHMWLLPRWFSG